MLQALNEVKKEELMTIDFVPTALTQWPVN